MSTFSLLSRVADLITLAPRTSDSSNPELTMSSSLPTPQPGILAIDPYVPGESSVASGLIPIKLSSNESPLGPSPKAVTAFQSAAKDLARYPDGSATALRQALAAAYGLNAERIVCGAGSDEIISLIAHAYLGPGDEAIYSRHGFLMYRIATLAHGATPVEAPEPNLRTDVDAILAAVTARTKVVFLANPNNPTGTYIPIDEVRRLRGGLPGNVLLVLDAAYCEYVRRNDYEAGIELVSTTHNTVMTRTFSKIHGLAALRLGWAYCPAEVADALNRVRGPFNVGAPALAAGVAAIGDRAHLEAAIVHNETWLAWTTSELTKLGLEVTPSIANFVLVHFGKDPDHNADAAYAFLKSRGIIVRRMGVYGLPNALRITIGTGAENRALLEALGAFMEGHRA